MGLVFLISQRTQRNEVLLVTKRGSTRGLLILVPLVSPSQPSDYANSSSRERSEISTYDHEKQNLNVDCYTLWGS